MEATILLVDGLNGIHCIKRLIENYELFNFKGQQLDADDTADLLNPETSDDTFDWIEPSVRIDGEQYNVQWREGELIGVHVDALWSYHLDGYYVELQNEVEYTIPQYAHDALQWEAWGVDSEYWQNQIAYYGDNGKADYKRFRSWFDMRKKYARAIMAGRWRAVERDEFAHYNDVDSLGNTVYTILVDCLPCPKKAEIDRKLHNIFRRRSHACRYLASVDYDNDEITIQSLIRGNTWKARLSEYVELYK